MEVAIEVPVVEGMRAEAATVVKWLKKEGDVVRTGEPLLLVEFPKVELEVPSPASGVLVRILVREGKMARVHAKVGLVQT